MRLDPPIDAGTEREAQLRRSREFLEFAQEAGGFGVFDLDLQSRRISGSALFFELLGLPSLDLTLTQEQWLATLHPEDFESFVAQFETAVERGGQYAAEYRVLRTDGGVRWLDSRGRVQVDPAGGAHRLVGTITDITARKRLERSLAATREALDIALEAAGVATFDDDVQRRRLIGSDNLAALLGLAPGRPPATRRDALQHVHPADLEHAASAPIATSSQAPAYRIEYRVLLEDGEVRWIGEKASVARAADGSITRITGAVIDITDRKLAEQATIEARLAAEAANRAKSRFLANVSHEIRTPMNGVLGMAQLLADTKLDGTQRDYLNVIRESAHALLSLINDVLDFSKIEANRLELERVEFGLRDLIHDSAAAIAAQSALKGIELAVDVSREVPRRVCADPGRLRQILMNLLGNAIKFTHEGHVALRVTGEPADAGRFRVRIEVEDTGIGIPAERIDRLFQSFSQIDSSTTRLYGGTGLGLSIVKRLAELMDGEVGVASEAGRGSTFRVAVVLEAAIAEERPTPAGRGRRVLVVDDLAVSRDFLARKLDEYGFETDAVDGVEAALERLAANPDYAVVLADEWMPGRGGLDLLEAIRAQPRLDAVRFVLLSLFGAEPPDAQAPHRPDAICVKPVRGSALAKLVDRIVSSNAPAPGAPPPVPLADGGRSHRGRRVLIVEDNPVNQRVAQRMLGRLEIDAVVTSNGREALERLAAESFDAVLMDCQMPVMDGFAATERIRDNERRRGDGRRIPVIALSANVTNEDRMRCTGAGMDAHLSKPLDAGELRRCLDRFFTADDDAPAVDLGALRELTDGDADFERELIDTFIESGDRNLAEIREALRSRDFETIGRRAHALKSASANMRAHALSVAASDLESAVRTHAVDQLDSLVHNLADKFGRVNRQLRPTG